jgi:ribosomal peptide maturation radical SAM protein 1
MPRIANTRRDKIDGPSVLLVAMPWAKLERPSIQLGTLLAVLRRAGIGAEVRSYYLAFMQHLADVTADLPETNRISAEDYADIANRSLIGDWVFAVPPFCSPTGEREAYFSHLRRKGIDENLLSKMAAIQAWVPTFLEKCAAEILESGPRIVGFTSSFGQNVSSLVLSKILKKRNPSLRIIFGGANCDGCMGQELHRAFPWIDVVVRGEAEHILPRLVCNLLADESIEPQAGLCYRDGRVARVVDQAPSKMVPMEEVPTPVYDEYFKRLGEYTISSQLLHKVSIPFETARGCWWGAKSHCTFCGLNGSTMAFRSKAPTRAFQELKLLAAKHKRLEFIAVDNIIDMKYFNEFLPLLSDSEFDFELFYETKANLKKEQLRTMRNAGVSRIQPGIESFSTPILKLMRKGVTGLQNIRLLKWCCELGIQVSWNIVYGFPAEPIPEYDRMADLITYCLTHLQPPDLVRLGVERFSPYHERPEEYGLTLMGAQAHYRFIYRATDVELDKLAYSFDYRYADARDPETYVPKLKAAVDNWKNQLAPGSLCFSRGPGFSVIKDRRAGREPCDYRLGDPESQIYLACDAGTSPGKIWELLKAREAECSRQDIEEFLLQLLEAGLVYEEDGKFLSLAIPVRHKIQIPVTEQHRDFSSHLDNAPVTQIASVPIAIR